MNETSFAAAAAEQFFIEKEVCQPDEIMSSVSQPSSEVRQDSDGVRFGTSDADEAVRSLAQYAGVQVPDRPSLAPWVTLIDLGDNRLQFRAAEFSFTLSHDLFIEAWRRVKQMLDGRHTVEEIAAAGGSEILPTTVVFLLKILRANGLLQPGSLAVTSGDGPTPVNSSRGSQLTFLSHFGDAEVFQSCLTECSVGIVGEGPLAEEISTALDSIGIDRVIRKAGFAAGVVSARTSGHAPELDGLDLLIAVAETPAFGFFEAVNQACLESGTRWMRVVLYGTTLLFGPTFIPCQTACYTCYNRREEAVASEGFRLYRDQVGKADQVVHEGIFPPLSHLAAGQVALEVTRLVTGFAAPTTLGRFYEFTARLPIPTGHDVLRAPRCPSCGRGRVYREVWDQAFTRGLRR